MIRRLLLILALLPATVSAQFLIGNGKLDDDLNANQYSITNLNANFYAFTNGFAGIPYIDAATNSVYLSATNFTIGVSNALNAVDVDLQEQINNLTYSQPTNGASVEYVTNYVNASTNSIYQSGTNYANGTTNGLWSAATNEFATKADNSAKVSTNETRRMTFNTPRLDLLNTNFSFYTNVALGLPTLRMKRPSDGSYVDLTGDMAAYYTPDGALSAIFASHFGASPGGQLVLYDTNQAIKIWLDARSGIGAFDDLSIRSFPDTTTNRVLVSLAGKKIGESQTLLDDLATDEEAVQYALNATNGYNTHVAMTYATKAEQQSGTNLLAAVVATKAPTNQPTLYTPTIVGAIDGTTWSVDASGNITANLFSGYHSGNGSSLTDISQGGVVGLFDALTYLTNRIVTTNGFVTAAITNGLAGTNYVNGATNTVFSQSTNAAKLYTDSVRVTTNGFVTATITNGLAPTNWVGLNFYPLTGNPSGFLTSVDLSDLTQSEAAAGNFPMWNGAAWVPKGGSPTLGDFLIYAADGWANTNNIHPSRIAAGGASSGNFMYFDGSEWAGVELTIADISVGAAGLGQIVKQVDGTWTAADLTLADIGQTGASAGQTIEWTAGGWVPVTRTDTLTTLSATAVAGDFPRYDGAGGWTNAALHIDPNDIGDGGANAADVMVYNPGAGGWQPTPLDLDYLGQSGAGVGQVPKWNGDNWVPSEDGTGSSTWTFDDTTTETTDGSTWVTVGTWDIAANSTQMAELTLTATVDPTTGTRAIMKGIWTFARTTGAWSIPNNGFAALADVGGWMATNMRFNAVDDDTISLQVKGWTSETCKWIVVGTVRAH